MKKAIYTAVGVLLNIVAVIVFRGHLMISEASSVSIVFMLVLGIMSWSFDIVKKGEMPLNTGGSFDLNDDEIARLGEILSATSLGMIPVLLPFVFFFNDTVKIVVSVSLLCSVVVVGFLAFRLAWGKKIKARLEKEEKERIEQEKSEH